MLWKKSLLVCMAVAAMVLPLPGLAQTATPKGRSVIARRPGDRAFLGIAVAELTDERSKALNLKESHGVEVTRVRPDSAAAKAGVKQADVILEVNGKAVQNVEQFVRSIEGRQPGAKVDLTIWRNGARQTVSATLDSWPDDLYFGFNGQGIPIPPTPPAPPGFGDPFSVLPGNAPRVGFEGEPLSPQLADYFGVKQGVLVRTVDPKTPAEKAGLKAGDIVVKVNGTPVTSPREITGLVRMSRGKTTFSVVRNKKEMTLGVDVSAPAPAGAPERVPL
jgi:serine protease Do